MKNTIIRYLISCLILSTSNLSFGADVFNQSNTNIETKSEIIKKLHRRPSIKCVCSGVSKALEALKKPVFSKDSIWDLDILERDEELSNLLKLFIEGKYGYKAKTLKLSGLNKEEIIALLNKEDFSEISNLGKIDELLGRGKDKNFQDSGTIYVHKDGSIVRIKDESSKRKIRPQSHVIKAVLRNVDSKPNWYNEAFKVTEDGVPVPKAPTQIFGLKLQQNYFKNNDEIKGWIDLIMEEVHIDIAKPKIANDNNISEKGIENLGNKEAKI